MILRKPYAFLIKHFKLIHLVLAILSFYSIYRTKILLDFFNEYVYNMINVIGQDLSSTLLPWLYFLTPILIIAVTIIILVVMIVKNKPNLFYVINIIIYIFALIIIFVSSSTLATMFRSLIDVRAARLVRDFITLSFIAQLVSLPIITIRAIGFDIKKFNFKEDLKDLEISDEDREEFEVQLNFDKNKTIRKFRRIRRFFKYSYKENKLLYNSVFAIFIIGIGYIFYSTFFLKAPTISQNVNFSGNGFTLNILDSYLVNTDYEGNILNSDYYYLLLKIKVKANGKSNSLNTATTKIVIGNYYYLPIIKYKEKFLDIGLLYQNEKIDTSFEEKILAYEIPKQLVDNEMIFSYVNQNSFTDKEGFKSTNVKINYNDLTGIDSNQIFMMGNKLEFTNSILSDYKINITNYEINDIYKISYNYCISNECFKSFEYLKPTLNTNYDKSLLKITGTLEKEKSIEGIYDLYDFIEHFGKICYNVDGISRTQNVKFNEVASTKTSKSNNYYIEVPSELKTAENISIIFTIRDRIYEYVLK